MAGLKEVAALAGVSTNTVSRALRRSGYLAPTTLENVSRAARQLNYRPHRAARSLRYNQSQDIAVIADSTFLHIQVIAAIQEVSAIAERTTRVFFVAKDFGHGRLPAILDALRAERPAGVICIGMSSELAEAAFSIQSSLPTVHVSYDHEEGMDCVFVDRSQGVADAVRHLYDGGRRRIAYVGDDFFGNKLKGYHAAIRELGLRPWHVSVKEPSPDTPSARAKAEVPKLARDLLALPEEPDGIITWDDYFAARFVAELPLLRRRVPEDVAVVGFDNRDFAEITEPPLTSIAKPNHEVGRQAANLLLERLEPAGKDSPPRSVRVPMHLVVRESTCPKN